MTSEKTVDPATVEKRWIAFDTEFIEDGRTIDLLSIGMVRADGATYYAEPAEADRSRASEWVRENVLPHLTGRVKPRARIAAEIIEFAGPNPEFWAYYADYDWVGLCQLYGTMMDLPAGWPMYCRDLKQESEMRGLALTQDDSIHNALGDARWVAENVAVLPDVIRQAKAEALREAADLRVGISRGAVIATRVECHKKQCRCAGSQNDDVLGSMVADAFRDALRDRAQAIEEGA